MTTIDELISDAEELHKAMCWRESERKLVRLGKRK